MFLLVVTVIYGLLSDRHLPCAPSVYCNKRGFCAKQQLGARFGLFIQIFCFQLGFTVNVYKYIFCMYAFPNDLEMIDVIFIYCCDVL